jgi:hypothetical protein
VLPAHNPAQTIEEFKQLTIEKLREVRCPVHHQSPKVRFQGSSLRDVSVQLSACCAPLIDQANQAIALGQAANMRRIAHRPAPSESANPGR